MGLKEAGLRGSLRNVSEATPAFYDVQITGTNEPITEGDTLDVNYQVQNTGDQDGIKDVFLEIDTVEEDRDSNISLSGGATATGTLQWVTQNGEAGTYNAVVLSPDDSDSVSVSVGSAIPDSVASRPDDNFSGTTSNTQGARINSDDGWPSIGVKISADASGFSTAYLRLTSDQSLIAQQDISGLTGGDTFTFDDVDLSANTDYDIIIDNGGNDYTSGANTNDSPPYVSPDGRLEITTGVLDGSSAGNVQNIVSVGNVGFQ